MSSVATRLDPGSEYDLFFRASYHRIVGLVAMVTGDPSSAEDAVQEAFARAAFRWDTIEHPERWVLMVATRVAISSWRRQRRQVAISDEVPTADPDMIQRLWVKWHLEQLTPKERRAVILHYVEGLTVDELAKRTGRSRETIKNQLFTARRRLRASQKREHK
jgi:RNA polymerase sigma-70 factor (ECF subfamily)